MNKSADLTEQKRQKLLALRIQYREELPQRIARCQQSWQTYLQAAGHDSHAELLRELHSLAGSAGSFGFAQVGAEAKRAELLVAELSTSHLPDATQRKLVEQRLQTLQQAAQQLPQAEAPLTVMPAATRHEPLLYLVEDDALLATELQLQLASFGWQVELCRNAHEAVARCRKQRPAALLVDVALPEGPLAGTELIAELKQVVDAELPCIVMSRRWDWEARIAAVRAGAAAYLPKPLDYFQLAEMLERHLVRADEPPYRILIVDDNALQAEYFATLLQNAGMNAEALCEPEKILARLHEFKPELILMDLYMPGCTGIEVARIIRQDREYLSVPIVFLSAETALQRQLSAMSTGADDFLIKPIEDTHLVTTITNRVQRFRSLTSLIRQDSMTGLLNHISFKLGLETEVSRARRSSLTLCAAMLDIDHFKKINDSYGHPVGDRVIRSLAKLLQRRLRSTDLIGRYGGEEFAIAFSDTSLATAVKLLNELREQFTQLGFACEGERFQCSFSAGVAELNDSDEAATLLQRADAALYEAKHAGRNRVAQAPKQNEH